MHGDCGSPVVTEIVNRTVCFKTGGPVKKRTPGKPTCEQRFRVESWDLGLLGVEPIGLLMDIRHRNITVSANIGDGHSGPISHVMSVKTDGPFDMLRSEVLSTLNRYHRQFRRELPPLWRVSNTVCGRRCPLRYISNFVIVDVIFVVIVFVDVIMMQSCCSRKGATGDVGALTDRPGTTGWRVLMPVRRAGLDRNIWPIPDTRWPSAEQLQVVLSQHNTVLSTTFITLCTLNKLYTNWKSHNTTICCTQFY